MADIIQLLPDHVANQIAAGEVVQRPASAVKELLENALDAGASSIKLIVKDGGKTLIQVVDNGSGMSPTDARMSFERHATSKIACAEDLFHIQTKGFRGEALASIAAIAHVDMQTRKSTDEVGTHLRIEGSEVVFQEVTVTPEGTSISVKNLFYNIPARRNFLKSDQVEIRHIIDEFHRVALAHPAVSFHFFNNGGELFNLSETNFRKRIVHIFGRKTNEKLVPVKETTDIVNISGFICKPEYARRSRGEQFFFVNDRFIKSPYLHHAVVSAFEGLIRPDAFPGYFLYLRVNSETIDINIHPTKTEVKFHDEHTLYAVIRSTVKHSLGQFNVVPSIDFESDPNLKTPYNYQSRVPVMPKVMVDSSFNPFKRVTSFEHGATQFKKPVGSWEGMYVGLSSAVGREHNFEGESYESDAISGSIFGDKTAPEDSKTISFQLKRKYIVTTIKSGMLVIDQHRAHQRVIYEKFLEYGTINDGVSQQLLFPLTLSFSKSEIAKLKEIRASLTTVGFMFGSMEDEQVEVSGIPPLVPESEVGIVMDQLLRHYGQEADGENFSQTDLLSKSLCKSLAVKSGEVLNGESRLALVNDLFGCKESRVSPFNKPIYITISENDINTKFL